MGRRAAIVGAEGAGKSTLLENLAVALERLGKPIRHVMFRPGDGARFSSALRTMEPFVSIEPNEVLLLDGFDHLPRLSRFQLLRGAARRGGLLATSHRRERGLPSLIELAPSPDLLSELVRDLLGEEADRLDLAEVHRRHRGNLRTALRELYDVWAAREGPEG